MNWLTALLFVGLILIVILLPLQLQQIYGLEYFEKTDFRLSRNPNICYLAPLVEPLMPNLDSHLYDQTQLAVNDWQTKLNQGSDKVVWKMNLVYVPNEEYMDDKIDSSFCDIVISFLPRPDTENIVNVEPSGITETSSEQHTAVVKIYYLQLDFERNILKSGEGIHSYPKFTWTTFYLDKIATDDQLKMAIKHGLGHAFGMGNYVILDQGLDNGTVGIGKPPSIMVNRIMPIDYNEFEITPIDIEELKSLYGNLGFESESNNKTNLDQSTFYKNKFKSELAIGSVSAETFDQTMLYFKNNGEMNVAENGKFLGHVIMPSWFKKNITWWLDGSITEGEFATSIQYLKENGILQF